MYKDLISIVIPVKESPTIVDKFISGNLDILSKYTVIAIDSGGGSLLGKYALTITKQLSMSEARKYGYNFVVSPYILNLDVDTILPESFIDDALMIMKCDSKIAVIALDYEELQGHLAFGTSVWKTEILKKLYDYIEGSDVCECLYIWKKVINNGYRLETLPYRAIHIKEK